MLLLDQIQKNSETTEHQGHKAKYFQCIASNTLGSVKQDLAINIGKPAEPPIIDNYTYDNGYLTLRINTTEVKLDNIRIDGLRVEFDNSSAIYFNDSKYHDNKHSQGYTSLGRSRRFMTFRQFFLEEREIWLTFSTSCKKSLTTSITLNQA